MRLIAAHQLMLDESSRGHMRHLDCNPICSTVTCDIGHHVYASGIAVLRSLSRAIINLHGRVVIVVTGGQHCHLVPCLVCRHGPHTTSDAQVLCLYYTFIALLRFVVHVTVHTGLRRQSVESVIQRTTCPRKAANKARLQQYIYICTELTVCTVCCRVLLHSLSLSTV